MKRRDFIKTTACLGCAGALSCHNLKACASVIENTKVNLTERKFIYKSEAELPKTIRIDICNLCQLHCAACWMREWEEDIKKNHGGFGYVPFETYKDFVDKHPFLEEIELSFSGEMFLNPDLDKIIEYSYEKGIKLTGYNGVNLNTLSKKTAENLVKYQFKGMTVSIDGATAETYAIYRKGGDFNTVINNIKMINKFKKKYNSEYPHLTYKMVLFSHNEHEVSAAKKLAKELNMDILFDVNSVTWYDSPLSNPDKTLVEAGLRSTEPVCLSVENIKNNPNDISRFICNTVFNSPQINWNGELIGCNAFYGLLHHDFNVNVFEEGLFKALNNEKYLYTKAMLSTELMPDREFMCSDCMVFKDLKNYQVNIS